MRRGAKPGSGSRSKLLLSQSRSWVLFTGRSLASIPLGKDSKTGASTAWNFVSGVVSGAWNFIRDNVFNPIVNFVMAILTPIWNVLSEVISTVWNTISTVIGAAWNWIRDNVLQPLWDFISSYIIPIFQLIGAIVEIVFTLIGLAIYYAWTSVIWPVFKAIWNFINNDLGSVFNWLYENVVKPVWNAIQTAISWAWNNVIKPVFDAIWGFLKNTLGPVFSWLYDNVIQPVWNAIQTAVSFAWNNVIKPVFDAINNFLRNVVGPAFTWLRDNVITPVWNGISSTITGVWNTITSAIRTGVNFAIGAFNSLAGAVNSIGDKLHIGIHVDPMPLIGPPQMAAGGVIPQAPRAGGVFNKVRAIVGEGSNQFPEYVIPTDPRFRGRALELLKQANVRMLADGGVVGTAGAVLDDLGGWLDTATGKVKSGMANSVLNPIFAAVEKTLQAIPITFIRDMIYAVENDIRSWVAGDTKKGIQWRFDQGQPGRQLDSCW